MAKFNRYGYCNVAVDKATYETVGDISQRYGLAKNKIYRNAVALYAEQLSKMADISMLIPQERKGQDER